MSDQTALYRLFGEDDLLLYTGIANYFGRRWHEHARSQPWWPRVRRQTVEWYPSRDEAHAAEIAAIGAERPLYNIAHNDRPQGLRDVPPVAYAVAITAAAEGRLSDKLLTRSQAAQFLAVDEDDLVRWRHSGGGPRSYTVRGEARYDLVDLRAFAAAGRNPLRVNVPRSRRVACPKCQKCSAFTIGRYGDELIAFCMDCSGRMTIEIVPDSESNRNAA